MNMILSNVLIFTNYQYFYKKVLGVDYLLKNC